MGANNEDYTKYLKQGWKILILVSIILATIVASIIFALEESSVVIFLGFFISLLISNYINLYMVYKFVVNPIIDELKQQKKQYSMDGLTGVCRREVFEERRMFYQTECSSLGILFVDVNNLKKINDTYGHYAGDELIIEVANSIKKLREECSNVDFFRVGGDEFIIVIKDKSEQECKKVSKILKQKISCIRLKTVPEHRVEAAMGLAYSNTKINVSALLEKADAEMYRNKNSMKSAK